MIAQELARFRKRKVHHDLMSTGWFFLAGYCLLVISLLFLEPIFWFSTAIRTTLLGLMIFLLVGGLAAILGIPRFISDHPEIERYSFSTVAKEVGNTSFQKFDQVLNALQLESAIQQAGSSRVLAHQFIQQVVSVLSKILPENVYESEKLKKSRRFAIGITCSCLFLAFLFPATLKESIRHWVHPRTDFPVPLPFELVSLTGDVSAMGGDMVNLEIVAKGKVPESIFLEVKDFDKTHVLPISQERQAENFFYQITHVSQNLSYRAFALPLHFWEPWKEISSPTYAIEVIDRPRIAEFFVTVQPPDYSHLKPFTQKENIGEIRGLKGSQVEVQLLADKPLSSAYLNFVSAKDQKDSEKISMEVSQNRAIGKFKLMKDGKFSPHIFDSRNIANFSPISYYLVALEDFPPSLKVIKPASFLELGSDFTIPVHIQIEDDFGFSQLQIVYELKHPEYLSEVSEKTYQQVKIHSIPGISRDRTSQDVYYLWKVDHLNMIPEDEILFHFELYDNDGVSGPKKAVSSDFRARFPSMADLLAKTSQTEEEVTETLEELTEELNVFEKTMESVERDLLKEKNLSWNQKQKIQESLQSLKSQLEKLQQVQNQIQDVLEESEKYGLVSSELAEKFRNLQELLQQIVTPEMIQAMKSFQEALENAPPEQLMQALKNFQVNADEMASQIDRFMELFKRVQAEKRMDELVAWMKRLTEQQGKIGDNLLSEKKGEQINQMTFEEERILKEFGQVRDQMKLSSEEVRQYSKPPADELDELSGSEIMDQTESDLKGARDGLKKREFSTSRAKAQSAHHGMEEILSQLQEIRKQFRESTSEEMAGELDKILQNSLLLSKLQETLREHTLGLFPGSPRLGEMAIKQQILKDQLAQLSRSVLDLSRKTFAVSPEMGKALGRATAHLNKSLEGLEARNGRESVTDQKKVVTDLNELALHVRSSRDAMRQSQMASGYDQFLKQLEQLAGQQAGINEQTLQFALGQMSVISQESLLRKLAGQQEQVRKSLEELMREYQGAQGSGSLKGAEEEMDAVLEDFRRQQVTRKTVERQQKILSRMLDSQKSLKQRDFSEKRKSRTGEEIIQKIPARLPEDLGQRKNLVIEALNSALKSGYSREYQLILKRYFHLLVENMESSSQEVGEIAPESEENELNP